MRGEQLPIVPSREVGNPKCQRGGGIYFFIMDIWL